MTSTYRPLDLTKPLCFSSCHGCTSSCCDGSRFLFAPLILEDFDEVYRAFPIVFAKLSGEWRIVMMMGDNGKCRYYHDNRCTVYDSRPPSCRIYPLSPYFDDILVDTACPAVNPAYGSPLADDGRIHPDFDHRRLQNFDAKRQKTVAYLRQLTAHLRPIGQRNGIDVYRYDGPMDDPYIRMHRTSLLLHWTANKQKTAQA